MMSAKTAKLLAVLALAALSSACVKQTPSMYQWGAYEPALYAHYSGNENLDLLGDKLANAIAVGEAKGKVPPGIYAEFGYVRLSQGNAAEAITFFDREKQNWPESTLFMDRMITLAKSGTPDTKKAPAPEPPNPIPTKEQKNAAGV